jgi:membrane-associated protein
MEPLINFLQFFLHIDQHLAVFIANYGLWTCAVLFVVIFCETGLVVMPFLPGDSLLFATGALSAGTVLNVNYVVIMLVIAAICGDSVNYCLGRWAGERVFRDTQSRWLNRKYLDKAHQFYEKYGPKAIIIARFVPIVRTFVPFTAGLADMGYRRFILFSLLAAIIWVSLLVYAGFWFGGLDVVRQNFSLVIMAIIIISILPAVIEYVRGKRVKKADSAANGC